MVHGACGMAMAHGAHDGALEGRALAIRFGGVLGCACGVCVWVLRYVMSSGYAYGQRSPSQRVAVSNSYRTCDVYDFSGSGIIRSHTVTQTHRSHDRRPRSLITDETSVITRRRRDATTLFDRRPVGRVSRQRQPSRPRLPLRDEAAQSQSTLASAGDALGVQGGALLPPKVFARRHVPIGAWHRLDNEVDQFDGGRGGAKEVVVEDAQLACGGVGVRAG